MRRIGTFVLLLALAGCAFGQFNGYVGLQTVQQQAFNAVTSAQTSSNLQNAGQAIHLLQYKVAGSATLIQIRLEGTWDGTNFFAISDDATDLTQGEVMGVGYYPAVRANLVQCVGCGGGVTVTANYSGYQSGTTAPFGFYNPSQQVRKVLFTRVTQNAGHSVTGIPCPYGSGAGILVYAATVATSGSPQLTVTGHVGDQNFPIGPTYTFTTGFAQQVILVPATACTSIDLSYTAGTAAGLFSMYYVFYPPGQAPTSVQPPAVYNTESTSAVNTAVTKTIVANVTSTAYLYSVSARCSAGTAQLTVSEGATVIWSTAATEVGTTTFRYQWNPALAMSASTSNMNITLSTCGAGNTGTLDVQATQF